MNSVVRSLRCYICLLVFALGGCSEPTPNEPVPSLGPHTIRKYVAVGNSLTAGYQSAGLYKSAQDYSYPNLLARQLSKAGASIGTFEQPYYSDPGTPDPATGKASRLELISLIGPVITPRGLAPGSPLNAALVRPYDNLGIPGLPLAGFMDETNATRNPLVDLVLRSDEGFPKSVYKQVVALQPDLITFWLGANDVLGYATSGGVSPSEPTSQSIFTALYSQALDSLRKALPNAKIVVATIPDVRALPFFTTIGPVLGPQLATLGAKLVYQKHGEAGVASGQSALIEASAPLLTLNGVAYLSLLGKPTGQWYRDTKRPALPAGIDTTKPFGLHSQNPWPDALTLDGDEQNVASQAIIGFNSAIASSASRNGAALVDIHAIFNSIIRNGYKIAGETYTTAFLTGGIFSLDGAHPSSRGYAIVANEYIGAINSKFGTSVPLVDFSEIPGIPVSLGKTAQLATLPKIPASAFKVLEALFHHAARY